MVATGKKGVSSSDEALRQRSAFGQAIMLGTNVAVGMLLFTLLGAYADRNRGTGNFWTLIGVVLGILFVVYEFWKTVRLLRSLDQPKPGTTDGRSGDGGKTGGSSET